MNEFPTLGLWCIFGIVIIGGAMYFGGRILADWWFGRVPGGRGK